MSRPPPLAGLRVLDLTRLLPGPLATQHLADMGADVIKVEDTGGGDYARTLGPMAGDTAYLFLLTNRNKRGLTLDLRRAEGREVFLRLAAGADVIVEGFRPGVVERLGIDYATVRAHHPRVVYCAITGYGQTGPYRDRAGHDLNYIGYAGVLDQTGSAGGPPAIPSLQLGDLLGGTACAVMGILAGVIDARLRGEGRYVDVAMADCVAAHHLFPLMTLQADGAGAPRGADVLTGALPCYGVYATADGRYLAVGALEAKFWATLCTALERPDLLAGHTARGAEGARVRAELAAIFASRPQAYWAERFAALDCCVSPVLDMAGVRADPHFAARGLFAGGDTPGNPLHCAFPVRFSDAAAVPERPPPAPGEHTDAVLAEAGYDTATIARLRRDGVV
ncbi:crotonobetainyl-CoA:carnitine CoA-transferase CaiB-like acyl-CoA transferase [Plasticicumulans lactativorans]|uniref:Crotonobetainyl-CoA:carnitine CoA-transferase CaiB-like acyl-CoA transferase n=1 Tax=Plasticicumulans lactativorans TaxID=1133106 RepID=A0A4R2L9E7_9GAMM|nr:CaiB/BaiF CoA-transferase family protein [Plasticicumulans lactativorans]TCO83779.1 crotonobetainyl-CoA:carnitine CoA-transferase CaiB-like acyl-CoA transferase [Plasticicumulans lactativorans]